MKTTDHYLLAGLAVIILGVLVVFLPTSALRGVLATFAYLIVPGWVYARVIAPDWVAWQRNVLGFMLAVVVAPFLLILLARGHLLVTPQNVAGLFSGLSLLGLLYLWWRHHRAR